MKSKNCQGNSHTITDYLLVQMRELAEQQRFEEAQQLKKVRCHYKISG